jgi:hypothetical protein
MAVLGSKMAISLLKFSSCLSWRQSVDVHKPD